MDFQAKLISIETAMNGEIRREYWQVRLKMLALLNDLGGNSPTLPGQLRSIMATFKTWLAEMSQRFLLRIRELLTTYTADQFDNLGLSSEFNVNQLMAETSATREEILSNISSRLQESADSIMLTLSASLINMTQAGADDQAIAKRLFALQPTDGRVSEWRNGRNLLISVGQTALFTSAVAGSMLTFSLLNERLKSRRSKIQVFKVAVATIDARTTQTCSRINGQIQPVDKPFIVTGTPRYADEKMLPPFHDYCRTVVAIERGNTYCQPQLTSPPIGLCGLFSWYN